MLKLFLPILFPSWRFFSSIGPSPRIEMGFVVDRDYTPQEWLPFRPLPKRINFTLGLQQLFHNPVWNERLFINTCAEYLFEEYSEDHEQEIGVRLVNAVLNKEVIASDDMQYMVFRICAIEAEGGKIQNEVVFVSKPFALIAAGGKE